MTEHERLTAEIEACLRQMERSVDDQPRFDALSERLDRLNAERKASAGKPSGDAR